MHFSDVPFALSSYCVQGLSYCGENQTLGLQRMGCAVGETHQLRGWHGSQTVRRNPQQQSIRGGGKPLLASVFQEDKGAGACVGICNLVTPSRSSISWPTAAGSSDWSSDREK